jgi:hypothetical protein
VSGKPLSRSKAIANINSIQGKSFHKPTNCYRFTERDASEGFVPITDRLRTQKGKVKN